MGGSRSGPDPVAQIFLGRHVEHALAPQQLKVAFKIVDEGEAAIGALPIQSNSGCGGGCDLASRLAADHKIGGVNARATVLMDMRFH